MSEFAKQLAAQIKSADEQRAEERKMTDTESAAFAERERVKRKLAPDLWSAFRELIVGKCSEVNKEVGKEHYRCHDEMPNKLHVIRLNPIANLHLEFFPEGSRIHFDVGECVGEYLIEIDGSTEHAILSNAYHQFFELESTAEHLLQDCLEKAPF
jgi:hypothetical protein